MYTKDSRGRRPERERAPGQMLEISNLGESFRLSHLKNKHETIKNNNNNVWEKVKQVLRFLTLFSYKIERKHQQQHQQNKLKERKKEMKCQEERNEQQQTVG